MTKRLRQHDDDDAMLRTRVDAPVEVEWIELLPELLKLTLCHLWIREGMDDLKKLGHVPPWCERDDRYEDALKKLRRVLATLNRAALVCRAWQSAIHWSEIWHEWEPIYSHVFPDRICFTVGTTDAPNYHAMLCASLVARDDIDNIQRETLSDWTKWDSYRYRDDNNAFLYNEEVARLGFVHRMDRITSYYDYDLEKWIKTDLSTTIAHLRRQEQWWMKCWTAYYEFVSAYGRRPADDESLLLSSSFDGKYEK